MPLQTEGGNGCVTRICGRELNTGCEKPVLTLEACTVPVAARKHKTFPNRTYLPLWNTRTEFSLRARLCAPQKYARKQISTEILPGKVAPVIAHFHFMRNSHAANLSFWAIIPLVPCSCQKPSHPTKGVHTKQVARVIQIQAERVAQAACQHTHLAQPL